MADFAKLVASLAFAFTGLASAGYAQLQPPSGWSAGTGTAGATFRGAANEAVWLANGTVRTNAVLNVGGRSAVVPAAMRMAANAPLFAARAMFLSPWTAAALIAAPIAYQWAKDAGFLYDTDKNLWQKKTDTSGYMYNCAGYKSISAVSACEAYASQWNIDWHANPSDSSLYWRKVKSCTETACVFDVFQGSLTGPHAGTFTENISKELISGEIKYDPATQTEFENKVTAAPMPWQVPNEVPFDVPVGQPVLNPSPLLQPQPLLVPQGSPQLVPNSDPAQYKQPMVRVTPAPTTANPWQADVTPEDVTGTDPNGQVDPATPAASSPVTSTPADSDLCLLHPEIIACQSIKFDTPDAPDLPITENSISVALDSGWGATNAACPAPRYIYPQGRAIPIPFDLFCQYMSGIRPIIIALAWLGAGFILIGARGGD